jgi:hypothetical protein
MTWIQLVLAKKRTTSWVSTANRLALFAGIHLVAAHISFWDQKPHSFVLACAARKRDASFKGSHRLPWSKTPMAHALLPEFQIVMARNAWVRFQPSLARCDFTAASPGLQVLTAHGPHEFKNSKSGWLAHFLSVSIGGQTRTVIRVQS